MTAGPSGGAPLETKSLAGFTPPFQFSFRVSSRLGDRLRPSPHNSPIQAPPLHCPQARGAPAPSTELYTHTQLLFLVCVHTVTPLQQVTLVFRCEAASRGFLFK